METFTIVLSINKQKVSCTPIDLANDDSNELHMKCAVQVMRELTIRARTQLRVGSNFIHTMQAKST